MSVSVVGETTDLRKVTHETSPHTAHGQPYCVASHAGGDVLVKLIVNNGEPSKHAFVSINVGLLLYEQLTSSWDEVGGRYYTHPYPRIHSIAVANYTWHVALNISLCMPRRVKAPVLDTQKCPLQPHSICNSYI